MSRFTYLVGFVVLLHTSCSYRYEPTQEQQAIVDQHNSLRRGVSPTASNMLKMSWNTEAASTAQTHADGCSMAHSSRDTRPRCGEILYMSSNKRSWDKVIQSWYDEVKNYKYGVGSVNGGQVGTYTQVVWYRSNEIGCAMAECPNAEYKYFYVCHYSPVRYYQVGHPYKEGKPCADCPDSCDDRLCTNPCLQPPDYSTCPSLKEKYGCSHPTMASWCPSTCKCTNEII